MIRNTVQRRARRILPKLNNALWEYRLGISTRGVFRPKDYLHGVWERHSYSTIPYRSIFKILRFLALKNTDVFVDLGCGKGRVICCAARYDLVEVIGVEYLEHLSKLARRNLHQLRGRRSPVSVISGVAEDFDFTQGTAFYLYNPFGPKTMSEILSKLRYGLDARDREVRIAYVNAMHEELLADTPWLKHYGTLPPALPDNCDPTSFWISR